MSKLLIVSFMALAALTADAQSRRGTTRRGAVGADGGAAVAKGKDARVLITRSSGPCVSNPLPLRTGIRTLRSRVGRASGLCLS